MKLFAFECRRADVIEKRIWIEKELGLSVFKIDFGDHYAVATSGDNLVRIVFVVPNEETENFLRLKYPRDRFKDLSA